MGGGDGAGLGSLDLSSLEEAVMECWSVLLFALPASLIASRPIKACRQCDNLIVPRIANTDKSQSHTISSC